MPPPDLALPGHPPEPFTNAPSARAADASRYPFADPAVTTALLVELDLNGRHGDAVHAWVEGTLGWQPVTGAATALVPPALVLRDLGSVPDPDLDVSLPSILLVDDDASAVQAGALAAQLGPDAVVAWPSGRDRLVEVAEEVVGRPRPILHGGASLRVGGSAGGVGTSTVALSLAGLAAWHGVPTLAAVRGAGLRPRVVPTAALAGIGIWARADPLPGLDACRAVRLVDADEVPRPTDPAIGMLVIDAGVDDQVDVLVCRPDAAALEALATTTAAAVVVVGEGAASGRDLRRAAAGRRGITVPWSSRVARAGLTGRVPAGLPGAWLRALVPLLPDELSPRRRTGAGSP